MKRNHIASLILFSALLFGCKKEDLVDTSQNQLVDINSEVQFNEGIASGVSMVFFHASWCVKCAAQRPAVESISIEPVNKDVFFAEVEYEDHKEIVKNNKIDGFPTIVIYKDKVEFKRFTGNGNSEETLQTQLNLALK